MIEFDIRAEIDIGKLQSKRRNATKTAQKQLDQDVIKDSNYYAPQHTGNLIGSALRASKIGQGLIVWDVPQARRLYYNPQYNFSKDKNPNAQGLWFEAAKASHSKKWLSEAKNSYKKAF